MQGLGIQVKTRISFTVLDPSPLNAKQATCPTLGEVNRSGREGFLGFRGAGFRALRAFGGKVLGRDFGGVRGLTAGRFGGAYSAFAPKSLSIVSTVFQILKLCPKP